MNLEYNKASDDSPNQDKLIHSTVVEHLERCSVYSDYISENLYDKSTIIDFIKGKYNTETGANTKHLKCWQSNYFLHTETAIFDNLIKIINQKINQLIPLQHNYHLTVSELWAAVYKKGDYALLHGHGRYCQYSGVLYLQCNEKHPGLEFEDNFHLPSIENMIYIFNSTYKHRVPQSQIENLRIVLGFNFYVVLPHLLPI